MRIALIALFSLIFVSMTAVVVWAMLQRGMLEAGSELMKDRWFHATLVDAYFGFVTFYVWVFYKERSATGRGVWLVLIMTLGNLAMSAYMLRQLWRLPPDASWADLLLRSEST